MTNNSFDQAAPPVIFIMGPTAVGKTDLALAIAQRFDCGIISVDSAMVYRGMDIGTAKPDAATLSAFPHRLIDICDPVDAYSAGRFRSDALTAIREIIDSGRLPLLVGGTMLYFRALQNGLARLPSADPETRSRINEQANQIGWAALHRRLQSIDPVAAGRIQPEDSQRIQRALEVFELTGEPMSELWQRSDPAQFPYRFVKIVLWPSDRKQLHRRIAARFERMLQRGFVDEVQELKRDTRLRADLPAMRAVGYRQIWDYLDGKYDVVQAQERGIVATRQLAKRQLTALRREEDIRSFQVGDIVPTDNVVSCLRKELAALPRE